MYDFGIYETKNYYKGGYYKVQHERYITISDLKEAKGYKSYMRARNACRGFNKFENTPNEINILSVLVDGDERTIFNREKY